MVVVLMVVTSLAGAGQKPAEAAAPRVTGVEEILKFTGSNSLSPKIALAQCPVGKQVLGGGGGVASLGGPDVERRVTLTQLEPYINTIGRHNYSVTAAETAPGTTDNWYLVAFAICADPVPGHDIVAQGTGWSTTSLKETAAACPNGKRALGTGARINPFNLGDQYQHGIGLQVVRASGSGDITRAQAQAQPAGYAANWQLLAFAVCANTPQGYEVSPYGESLGRESEPDKGARVDCPGGKQLLGGGATVGLAPANVTLNGTTPWQHLPDPPSAWEARAFENTTTPLPWSLAAQAICADA
jgi:hypothetical protein